VGEWEKNKSISSDFPVSLSPPRPLAPSPPPAHREFLERQRICIFLSMNLKCLSRGILDAIYPPLCSLCGELSTGTHPHCCGPCFDSFEPVGTSCCTRCGEPFPVHQEPHLCLSCLISSTPFGWCRGLYLYRGRVAEALSILKYGKEIAQLGPLVEAVVRGAASLSLPEADVVVPVPVSRQVLFNRGFNCAALLAKPLAQYLDVPMVGNVLSKRGKIPQVGLGRSARQKNAATSFMAGKGMEKVRGKKVILFDDVYTTGATAGVCARVIGKVAASVSVLTLARRAPENLQHLFLDMPVGSKYHSSVEAQVITPEV
jgi:ComF family protein